MIGTDFLIRFFVDTVESIVNRGKEENKIIEDAKLEELFHDPLAAEIAWSSIVKEKRLFLQHTAWIPEKPHRMRYIYSLEVLAPIMFFWQWISACAILFLFALFMWSFADSHFDNMGALVLLSISSLLFWWGLKGRRGFIFDKEKGYFWKGRQSPDEVSNPNLVREGGPLEDIHALQLLKVQNSDEKLHFELILVTCEGDRHLLSFYKKLKPALEDAGQLTEFLQVPLWNGSWISLEKNS